MALDEAQTTKALLLLGLPARTDVTFYQEADREKFRLSEIARRALGLVNFTQQEEVEAILAQWQAVRYDADRINAEGLDSDPTRTRALLRQQLADIIGVSLDELGGGGMTIRRG